MRNHTLGTALALSGLLAIFGSLTIAYLDSVGYWNYPKDFVEALLRNRGFEPIGLGIQGLQLYHYFVGGAVVLVLGVGLLLSGRGITKVLSTGPAIATQDLSELKEKIQLLEREKQNLRLKLWKYESSPSALAGYLFLALGSLALMSAAISDSSVMSFIGLGLAFWGVLFLYIRPKKYVRAKLLTCTAISSLAAISEEIEKLGLKGRAIYLPPERISDIRGGKLYIAKEVGGFTNLGGLYLTPPGLSLTNLYEEELGVHFAETDLSYLQTNLPLLMESLEIAEDVGINVEGNKIRARIKGSVYQDLCKQIRKLSPNICSSTGCPLISSMALAIARSAGRQVIIEENQILAEGQTIEVDFRLLGERPRTLARRRGKV